MTTITVAIPCYNGAGFVGKCIEAVLEQDLPADQVLVIEDGSKDNSAEIIQQYPVQMIQHPDNKGLATGRNTALTHAQTDILVYVDVDAYADPGMLKALETEFTSVRVAGVGGQGIEAAQHNIYDRWRRRHATQSHGPRKKVGVEHLYGLCMAYRPEVLRELGGFNTDYRTNAEDVDMGIRLNKAGYTLVYTPEARVYHQRVDDHNSLVRMMYQWYYWGVVAKWRNNYQPWKIAAGITRRLFITDFLPDLFMERSLALAKLNLELAVVKYRAYFQATSDIRSGKIK